MSTAKTATNDHWPPQVKYIIGNEVAERFSYYGMKAILAFYITNVLMQSKDTATNLIHLFGFANYFMPVVGAWISDRLLGRYHTILWISLAYCFGHGVMAFSDAIPSTDGKLLCLYVGLGLVAFGSGGIKPCVSAFMGDQFRSDQGHLLQKAYAAFYFAINFGSFFSFLVIPWVRKEFGYGWAFGIPGIFMAIATFVFWLGTRHYVKVPPAKVGESAGFMAVFLYALRSRRAPGQTFWDPARQRFRPDEVDAASSLGPILSVFALLPVFWALYDQTFSTWVLQGERMRSYFVSSATALTVEAIRDPAVLAEKFRAQLNTPEPGGTAPATGGPNPAAMRFVWKVFSPAQQARILDTNQPVRQRAVELAEGFNQLIADPSFYQSDRFQGHTLEPDARLLWQSPVPPEAVARGNRLLLEGLFPDELSKLYRIGPEEMLSVNPILILILVPLMTWWLYPKLGRWVTPLRRMACGFFLSGLSFVVVAWLQSRIEAGAQLSIMWQILPYIILSIAEVLVSTTGLEFSFSQAAPSMKSTIMGLWYLAVALGNLMVSFLTKILAGATGSADDAAVSTSRFMLYAIMAFVVAVAFSLIATRYRYRNTPAG